MGDAVSKQSGADARADDIEALFTEAIEALDDGFAVYDGDFRVLYANAQSRTDFAALYEVLETGGTFKEGILNTLRASSLYDNSDDLEALADDLVSVFLSGETFTTPMADGRSLAITFRPMAGERWVATSIDMTDEQVRQEELKEANKEAEAASRAKSQFLANMSQDRKSVV